MMLKKIAMLVFVLITLCSNVSYAREEGIMLGELWKYRFSDDKAFMEEKLDDSEWAADSVFKRVIRGPEERNSVLWLRKHFVVPQSMNNSDLMLYISMMNTHEIYFNGHLIGKSRSTSPEAYSEWNIQLGYYIPREFIHFDQGNVISIKTYSTYEYGFVHAPFINDSETVLNKVRFHNTFYLGAVQCLSVLCLYMGIYFMMFYYRNRYSKKHLYFALVCTFSAILLTEFFIYDLPISYTIFEKIIYMSVGAAILFCVPFTKEFLGIRIYKWEKAAMFTLAFILVAGAVITSSLEEYNYFNLKYMSTGGIILGYCMVICFKEFFKGNKSALRLIIGFMPILLSACYDVYTTYGRSSGNDCGFTRGPVTFVFGFGIFLIAVWLELAREYNSMYVKASTDGLTSLHNHSHFVNVLSNACSRTINRSVYSLLILDIDFFKRFNDQYGHLAGDYVLRSVARILKANAGQHATVSRYGGEEFAIYVENCTEEQAFRLGEKLRCAVEKCNFRYKGYDCLFVTVSIGIMTVNPFDGEFQPQDIFEKADSALYYSKGHGRNRTTHYKEIQQEAKGEVLVASRV